MTKLGSKSLTDAFKKGLPIQFRGESVGADVFICRAEWNEGGEDYYARGERFRCDSERKAYYVAEQIMLAHLAEWAKARPNVIIDIPKTT